MINYRSKAPSIHKITEVETRNLRDQVISYDTYRTEKHRRFNILPSQFVPTENPPPVLYF